MHVYICSILRNVIQTFSGKLSDAPHKMCEATAFQQSEDYCLGSFSFGHYGMTVSCSTSGRAASIET